ncbi:MAG: hypothetical protein AAF800_11215 [Planctomycetota bacterium]
MRFLAKFRQPKGHAISGQQHPISRPTRFHVGDQVYTLVTLKEPLYDDSGEQVLTRVDHDRRLFILADACRGRHAVLGILTMMLTAWRHQRDEAPYDYRQLSSTAAAVERFLADMQLTDAAVDRLTASPPRERRRWVGRLPTLVAASIGLAAVVIGGVIFFENHRRSGSMPTAVQPVFSEAPLRDLATGLTASAAPFEGSRGASATHPTEPWFAFATPEQQVVRVDARNESKILFTAPAPITWLARSSDARTLLVADNDRHLHMVPWDGPSSDTLSLRVSTIPLAVAPASNGSLVWVGHDSSVSVIDPASRQTTRLLGVEQLVAASNGQAASAVVRKADAGRELQLTVNGQDLPLRVALLPGQSINDLAATVDRDTLALVLSDGLLLVLRRPTDAPPELRELQLPAPLGLGRLAVSPDGRTAMVVTDRLYRVDLDAMRPTAATDLPGGGGPVYDLTWRRDVGEIALARQHQGTTWR